MVQVEGVRKDKKTIDFKKYIALEKWNGETRLMQPTPNNWDKAVVLLCCISTYSFNSSMNIKRDQSHHRHAMEAMTQAYPLICTSLDVCTVGTGSYLHNNECRI